MNHAAVIGLSHDRPPCIGTCGVVCWACAFAPAPIGSNGFVRGWVEPSHTARLNSVVWLLVGGNWGQGVCSAVLGTWMGLCLLTATSQRSCHGEAAEQCP